MYRHRNGWQEDPHNPINAHLRPTIEMPKFDCEYAPQCSTTFASRGNMMRHCERVHGGVGRPFCTHCDDLKFFASPASLRNHVSNHGPDVVCEDCNGTFKRSSIKKHHKTCTQQHDTAYEHENDSVASTESIEPLYRAPSTGITRSAHAAPKQSVVETMMEEYVEWIKSPTALGKSRLVQNTDAFISKFRTTLGRLANFHGISAGDLLKRIAKRSGWTDLFRPDQLNKFTTSLATTDLGRQLRKSTVYNYIRTLIVFFEWKVDVKECEDMRPTLLLLKKLGQSLNLQKHQERNPEAKAARFENMPPFPELLKYVTEELRSKAIQAFEEFKSSADVVWEQYASCRDYILAALLIGVPPQRAQVFSSVSLRDIQRQDGHVILKVDQHKTAHVYGPVILPIPPFYTQQFEDYLVIREEFCASPDVDALFIGKDGQPEAYITKRFQAIIHSKFKCNISIRDCRSLFVTYASKHLDLTELHKLSRLMFHSFKTQQEVYRTDNAIQRAIDTLNSTTQALPGIPRAQEDSSEEYKEDAEESDEFDEFPDELFVELADKVSGQNF